MKANLVLLGFFSTALSVSEGFVLNPGHAVPVFGPGAHGSSSLGLLNSYGDSGLSGHINVHDEESGSDMVPLSNDDPTCIEIEDSTIFQREPQIADIDGSSGYPFALMMQGSAPYIAAHAGQIAVFHLPGDLMDSQFSESIISDIALARVLGMKIVLVIGNSMDTDSCDMDFDDPSRCYNALSVTDEASLRRLEESVGYFRTEVERKLNRCVKMHGGVSLMGEAGFVVSGNFFIAQKFGLIHGKDFDSNHDFEFAGFTSSVDANAIRRVLNNNDIVMLTTVGTTKMGDLVNVNGYHLAATTAAALDAYKLIYLANEGSVLCDRSEAVPKVIQELPLSFAQSITSHHGIEVHRAGFATFGTSQTGLEPRALELLLHLGWAAWAVKQGVTRAHIVNPTDGALLEELFTSKNGANTCLYHDNELEEEDDFMDRIEDWDSFFESAVRNGQRMAR